MITHNQVFETNQKLAKMAALIQYFLLTEDKPASAVVLVLQTPGMQPLNIPLTTEDVSQVLQNELEFLNDALNQADVDTKSFAEEVHAAFMRNFPHLAPPVTAS